MFGASAGHGKREAMRSSLLRLKLRELRERAQRAGASIAVIDEADEAKECRTALVELILKLELASSERTDSGRS